MTDETFKDNSNGSEQSSQKATTSSSTNQLYPKRKQKRKQYSSQIAQTTVNVATSSKANRVALLCIGGSLSVVLLARISGTPGTKSLTGPGDLIRIFVGSGAVVIVLMGIGEFAPDLSIHLSFLIFVAAFLTYGVDFATALSKGTLKPGIPMTPLSKGGQQTGR